MLRGFWVIALQQSVDGQTDRRTDRQTDRVITIGLPHLWWRGPNNNYLWLLQTLSNCKICYIAYKWEKTILKEMKISGLSHSLLHQQSKAPHRNHFVHLSVCLSVHLSLFDFAWATCVPQNTSLVASLSMKKTFLACWRHKLLSPRHWLTSMLYLIPHRRGNPLHLCRDSYKSLQKSWFSHCIPETIAHSLETNSNLLNIDWQHLWWTSEL